MNFDATPDERDLRDGLRALLDGRFPIERIRAGFSAAMHTELADAGVFSLRADGFGWPAVVLAYEELGRALVPGPLVWSFGGRGVVGGVEAGTPVVVEHLDVLDTLVVLGPGDVHHVDPRALAGERVDRPLDPLTPVWRVATLPPGEAVGGPAEAARLRTEGALLTSAFLAGVARRCCELAVAHAGARVQFGRVIGGFQAVKHLCADMAVRAALAEVAVEAAACILEDPSTGDGARAGAGARCVAGEAAVANGRAATQVLGGMGFTWEVDVHLALKRAWALDGTFGSAGAAADVVLRI